MGSCTDPIGVKDVTTMVPAVWAQVEQGVVPHLDAVMASVWALVRSGPNFDGRAADVERALWEAFDSIRAEERARCARIARNGCLVYPDGGSPTEEEAALCDEIARRICGA